MRTHHLEKIWKRAGERGKGNPAKPIESSTRPQQSERARTLKPQSLYIGICVRRFTNGLVEFESRFWALSQIIEDGLLWRACGIGNYEEYLQKIKAKNILFGLMCLFSRLINLLNLNIIFIEWFCGQMSRKNSNFLNMFRKTWKLKWLN